MHLPPTALLEGLSSCLSRAVATANRKQTKKSDRAAARGIAKKVVKVLVGPFAESHPSSIPQVAECILSVALAAPHTRKVALTATSRGSKLDHPLLRALGKVGNAGNRDPEPVAPVSPRKGKKKGGSKTAPKRRVSGESHDKDGGGMKGFDDAAHNRAVMKALAESAATDDSAADSLSSLLFTSNPRMCAVALAAANAALKLGEGSKLAKGVLRRFAMPTNRGPVPFHTLMEAEGAHETAQNTAVVFESVDADGLPTDASLEALARGKIGVADVEPWVVLTSLTVLPSGEIQKLGREVSGFFVYPPSPFFLLQFDEAHF